jgi:hypothetical protein
MESKYAQHCPNPEQSIYFQHAILFTAKGSEGEIAR